MLKLVPDWSVRRIARVTRAYVRPSRKFGGVIHCELFVGVPCSIHAMLPRSQFMLIADNIRSPSARHEYNREDADAVCRRLKGRNVYVRIQQVRDNVQLIVSHRAEILEVR